MPKVLIVDDQAHVVQALSLLFDLHGIATVSASEPEAALGALASGEVAVVIQDMNFSEATTSGEEGVRLFHAIRERDPNLPVILMTAWGSLETAVDLVKQGADDYLQKPWNDELLLRKVQNLLRTRSLPPSTGVAGGAEADLCGLLFQSAPMQAVVKLALKVAASDVSVLIVGPNGTGKEKLAELVHSNSGRKARPFVKVNVGALPNELFSAELFGAEAGAFTGAKGRRIGRFEAADGGTLLLDEIGTLSLENQAKLLRALQSGEFERLGSSMTRTADVRVVAATNVDMPAAIAQGHFREDLYYRLAVVELASPALKDRAEDVELLAQAFIKQFSEQAKAPQLPQLSPSCRKALRAYPWPGNVRELQNRVRRALLVCEGSRVTAEDMQLADAASASANVAAEGEPSLPVVRGEASLQGAAGTVFNPKPVNAGSLEQAERETLARALEQAGYVVSAAAKALGVSRQALYRRMQRLGIQVKREIDR